MNKAPLIRLCRRKADDAKGGVHEKGDSVSSLRSRPSANPFSSINDFAVIQRGAPKKRVCKGLYDDA